MLAWPSDKGLILALVASLPIPEMTNFSILNKVILYISERIIRELADGLTKLKCLNSDVNFQVEEYTKFLKYVFQRMIAEF